MGQRLWWESYDRIILEKCCGGNYIDRFVLAICCRLKILPGHDFLSVVVSRESILPSLEGLYDTKIDTKLTELMNKLYCLYWTLNLLNLKNTVTFRKRDELTNYTLVYYFLKLVSFKSRYNQNVPQ